MGDAYARGEADGAPHRIQMLDAVALHRPDVQAFEDAQRQQELETLRTAAAEVDGQAAIATPQRVFQTGLTASRSAMVRQPPSCSQMRDDRPAQRTAIEVIRTLARQRFQVRARSGCRRMKPCSTWPLPPV